MRTKVQDRRLKKLIEFLKKLPREEFFFGDEVLESKTNGHTCATVACAIGWTPRVFPRQIKWAWYDNGSVFWHYILKGRRALLSDVSQEFLGCPYELFIPHVQHEVNTSLEELNEGATPKQVAKMLEQYRQLCPAK